MKLSIPPLSQNDPRVKLKRLGNSTSTIGRYGCNLVCHSMFLRYLGQDLLPDALNEVYKNKGVFYKDLINFYAAGEAFENVWNADEFYNCMEFPCDLSKIDKLLDQKMPVIVMVDFDANPATTGDWHFVLIIGKENDSYLINDPWTGETYFFEAKYGDPSRMIYGLRIYIGKEVPNGTNPEDQLSDCKVSLESTNKALAEKSIEVGIERESREAQERDNADLTSQILESRNQRDTAIREKKEMAKEVERLDKEVSSTKEKIKGLREELRACKAKGISGMGLWQLLKLYFSKEVKNK